MKSGVNTVISISYCKSYALFLSKSFSIIFFSNILSDTYYYLKLQAIDQGKCIDAIFFIFT